MARRRNDCLTVKDQGVKLAGVVASFAQKVRAGSDAWVASVNSIDDSGILVDWSASDKQRLVNDFPLRSDAEVTRAVRDAFKYDPRLGALRPGVSIQQGTAVLSGKAESARARRAAEEDADDTVGVWDVRDEVLVASNPLPTDADIDRAVNGALSDDVFLAGRSSIRVSTSYGKVRLLGTVTSGNERRDAVIDVRAVPGVVEVDDQLTVELPAAEAKKVTEDRVLWDPRVPRDRVTVHVGPDGVATLSGTLDSSSEIKAASDDALRGGARRVINLLRLRGHPGFVAK